MKHIIRDFLVSVISISGVTFVYQKIKRRKGPLVRVLCFHDVSDKKWFEEVVGMLVKNYTVITPTQFHNQEFNQNRINILLTFDDGYQSWIDTCLPIWESFNLKGLFFINSTLLDIAHDEQKIEVYMRDRLLISPKKPLTWNGAHQLVVEGHSVGGHTVTHPNLALLTAKEVYGEVLGDKSKLESELGIEITDFAYPFGTARYFTQETMNEVARAGYTKQYSAITGFYRPSLDILFRTLIEKNQSTRSVKKWVDGGYDLFKLFLISKQ